jgi:hypothetical protein
MTTEKENLLFNNSLDTILNPSPIKPEFDT